MKKLISVFLFNILLLSVIFFCLDIFIYYQHLYISHFYDPTNEHISYLQHVTRPLGKKYIKDFMLDDDNFKKPINENGNKNSVILFGCSFVEGVALDRDKTFQAQLAKETQRPVYDRSRGGWGTQHMLFQLQQEDFYKKFKIPPEYVIYTYMEDHLTRIHVAVEPVLYGGYPTFVYSKYGNELKISKLSEIIFRFPLLSHIKQSLYYHSSKFQDRANLLKLHILKSKEMLDKHYQKDIPFYVLVYVQNPEIFSISDELHKNNVKMLYFEEITNKKAQAEDIIISATDTHPNAKAWEILIPKLNKYIQNYSEYEKRIREYEKKYMFDQYGEFNLSWKDVFSAKDYPSGFSICYKDNQLIEEKKINKFQAITAYVSWCFANISESLHIKPLAQMFAIISMKLNKYNEAYEIYYERF